MSDNETPKEPFIVKVLFGVTLVASLALLYVRTQEPDLTQIQLLIEYWYLPALATLGLIIGVNIRINFRKEQGSYKPLPPRKRK